MRQRAVAAGENFSLCWSGRSCHDGGMKKGTVGIVGLLVLLSLGIASAEVRTWTDTTGKFKIEAEFVALEDGEVTLRSSNTGKTTFPPRFKPRSYPIRFFVRRTSTTPPVQLHRGANSGRSTV